MSPASVLQHYLQEAREALVWKLDGLSEYDVRRPLVPTGTNLLGLVAHLTVGERYWFSHVLAGNEPASSWTARPAASCSGQARRQL